MYDGAIHQNNILILIKSPLRIMFILILFMIVCIVMIRVKEKTYKIGDMVPENHHFKTFPNTYNYRGSLSKKTT